MRGGQMIAPVSMVSSALDNKPITADAVRAIVRLRTGRYRARIKESRSKYAETLTTTNGHHTQAKEATDALKKQLPGVMFSGVFTARGDKNLTQHSGLICADLDHLSEEAKTKARGTFSSDPHVFALFESPTGTGLKVVFAVVPDASKHTQ